MRLYSRKRTFPRSNLKLLKLQLQSLLLLADRSSEWLILPPQLQPMARPIGRTKIPEIPKNSTLKNHRLAVYKDQAGRLWTGLATYWIKRGEFDRAQAVFEKCMKSVLTIRDFSQVFDAYAEFGQSILDAMMASLADEDEDDKEDAAETERELDAHMKAFEELADRRPFLHNDVLLRRNPNDVQEWEKRVALWGDDDEQVSWPCSYSLLL